MAVWFDSHFFFCSLELATTPDTSNRSRNAGLYIQPCLFMNAKDDVRKIKQKIMVQSTYLYKSLPITPLFLSGKQKDRKREREKERDGERKMAREKCERDKKWNEMKIKAKECSVTGRMEWEKLNKNGTKRKIKKENICIRKAHSLDPIHMQCNTYTNNTFHQTMQRKVEWASAHTFVAERVPSLSLSLSPSSSLFLSLSVVPCKIIERKSRWTTETFWKRKRRPCANGNGEKTNPYCLLSANVWLYWSNQKS